MSSRDLREAIPELREAVPKIIADYKIMFPNRNLIVISVARTAVEQWELFKIGRILRKSSGTTGVGPNGGWVVVKETRGKMVTTLDGFRKKSKHIIDEKTPLARAVDFGVVINGKYLGDSKDIPLYKPLRELAHKYGLIHGSDFPGDFKDWPHIENQGPFYLPKPTPPKPVEVKG